MCCAARPTCCSPSGPRPGRICWSGRCSPSSCSAPPLSLRTIPIIVKDRPMWRLAFALSLFPVLAASAPAQPAGEPLDAELQRARGEQAAAEAQAAKLEQAAAGARSEAERLRAEEDAA